MSLSKKVFSSALLLFIRKIWGNVVNLVVMAFLARILSKEDFGLLAISSVFLSIINTLATSGIAEYIIYYDGDDKPQKINAAFWLNLLLTIGVILVIVSLGPFWADFYQNEKIYTLLLLLLVSFFFEMTLSIPKALLRMDLEYKTLVLYGSVAMTSVSIGKLIAATAGLGVYSLALPQAIVSPFLMVAFFFKTKWRPYWYTGVKHFRAIFNYTRHIVGGRVLTKLVNEGDNIIVGKFVGLEGLGIYALAFQLANIVTANVVTIVNDIFLPLFSKVRNDRVKLKSTYLKMIRFLSFVSFPLVTLLALFAEPIVLIVYGEKWINAVIPFQILCLFALCRSISSPSSALYSAMGRPDIGFKFTLYFTPVFLTAVYLGSQFGVIGVAFTTTLVRVGGSLVSLYLALSLIQLNLSNLYLMLRSNLMATLLILLSFFWVSLIPVLDNIYIFIILPPVVLYFHFLFQRFFFAKEFQSFINDLEKYVNKGVLLRSMEKLFFISNK